MEALYGITTLFDALDVRRLSARKGQEAVEACSILEEAARGHCSRYFPRPACSHLCTHAKKPRSVFEGFTYFSAMAI